VIASHLLGSAVVEAIPPENIKKAASRQAPPQGLKHSEDSNEKPCAWQKSPEPWEESVDGEQLLDELRDTFTRHLILPDHAAATLAIWVLHTYSFQLGNIAAYLALLSPEKRCGKTIALSLVSKFCHRALPASNVSPAAVFRVIEQYSPTLLVDETDSFVAGKEELRGVLNAGYSRDAAFTIRCVGDDHDVRQFNLFGPKLFAGIGRLPDTLGDRCITVPMRRKLPGEKIVRLQGDLDGSDVRRKCMRWTNDHQLEIKLADPEMPIELDDRATDIWRPIMAIADLVGRSWPMLSHEAAVALSSNIDDEESINIKLLKDIRDYVKEPNLPRIKTEELLSHLHSLEERPWNTFHRGGGMTARQLADRMKSFGIKSTTIRFDDRTAKGYLLEDLEDAFNRYTYG